MSRRQLKFVTGTVAFLTRLQAPGFQAPAGHLLALAGIEGAIDAQLMEKNSLDSSLIPILGAGVELRVLSK